MAGQSLASQVSPSLQKSCTQRKTSRTSSCWGSSARSSRWPRPSAQQPRQRHPAVRPWARLTPERPPRTRGRP